LSLALAACSVAPLPLPTPTPTPTVERSPVPTLTPPPPPSETPAPSATPAPSETAPPSPTATVGAFTEPGGGDLLFEDPFNSAGIWGVGEAEDYAIAAEGGTMNLTVKLPDRWTLTFAGRYLFDFYAEVTATAAVCNGDDSYGLLYRFVDASNFYYFGLGCGARYRVRHYQDGEWKELVEWTAAEVVASGQGENGERRMAVRAVGSQFYFFANGEYLGEASDSTLDEGQFGLLAQASAAGGLAVKFDDLQVREAAP
jgi:hypothetical protein